MAVPKDAVESRGWSLAILEAQNQRPGEAAEKKTAVLEAIPIPKSILGAGSGGGARASPVAESYYQCDQCQVTDNNFKDGRNFFYLPRSTSPAGPNEPDND